MPKRSTGSSRFRPAGSPAASSRIELPYRAIARGSLLPTVDLLLRGPGGAAVPALGIVDSGADSSMFPLPLASVLGIDLGDCASVRVQTAGGVAEQLVSERELVAEVHGYEVRLRAAFAANLPVILLGRSDFFAAFRVAIDERAMTVVLEPYDGVPRAEQA